MLELKLLGEGKVDSERRDDINLTISKIYQKLPRPFKPTQAFFGSIENPLSGMEADHVTVGSILASINKLSNNYSVPEDACASFQLVYGFLAEFEEDLHQHIHLENNILFPKARALARELGV